MKLSNVPFVIAILAFGLIQGLRAQTPADEPTPSAPVSTQIEQEKLEIEKLKLENEKMQLEMERMTLQATQTAVPAQTIPTPQGNIQEDVKIYQSDASQKAEELAKANKDKDNLLVLDLVNGEVWNKGVRYNIHEIYALAEDRGWKMDKTLYGRDAAGHARTLYKVHNISLLKYENRDRGIFKVSAPSNPGDFDFLTPEGISFSSSTGDVRNAFQNLYFTYDSQERQGKLNVLRYNHSRGLAFSDKLEVAFDRDGKLTELRYGVLDER